MEKEAVKFTKEKRVQYWICSICKATIDTDGNKIKVNENHRRNPEKESHGYCKECFKKEFNINLD